MKVRPPVGKSPGGESGESGHPRAAIPLWLVASALLIALSSFLGEILDELGIPQAIQLLPTAAVAVAVPLGSWLLFRRLLHPRSLVERAVQLQRFCAEIKKAAGTLELQTLLDASAHVVADVTGVRGCSIDLLDSRTGKMVSRAAVGIDRDVVVDRAAYQRSLLRGDPLMIRDTLVREFPEVDDEIESLICVPLRLEERIFGAMCVYGERGQRLSAERISTLSSLGDVVSLALAHAFLYDDLRSLSETKTRFMLHASHELRSPANAIQSIAQTLLQGYTGSLTERQAELVERIDTRARILSDITSDLLTLAKGRLERASFAPVEVGLDPLVNESVVLFEERAKAAGVLLKAETGLSGEAALSSEEIVRSVLTNLIANAIKYTPAGGTVGVRTFAREQWLVIEVEDTGIGIPKEDQHGLFNEFFRAPNAKETSETGTGLGLAIVKAGIERCGGLIEFESGNGKGSVFRALLRRHAG